MTFIAKILLFIHLVGMAYLLGGILIQLKDKQKIINRAIRDGAYAQLVSGPLLFWIEASSDKADNFNDYLILFKSLFLLIILYIVFRSARLKKITKKQYYTILISALLAVAFAIDL